MAGVCPRPAKRTLCSQCGKKIYMNEIFLITINGPVLCADCFIPAIRMTMRLEGHEDIDFYVDAPDEREQ